MLIGGSASLAAQEESTNVVAVETAWTVFVEDDPTQCWSVSKPTVTSNTRDGREVQVQRGDILFFVTFTPAAGVAGELSFTGGYPFAPDSTVSLDIGGTEYEFYTEGEWAWPDAAEEAQIVATLKRGAEAELTARSARGTQTEDTFSLFGFTAAMDEAARRCGG